MNPLNNPTEAIAEVKPYQLLSFYSAENRCLKENFVNSVQDPWIMDIRYYESIGEEGGDYGTPAFLRLMHKKISFLIEKIQKFQGDVIVWSDVDIQFFRPCAELIHKHLRDKDILFLSERRSPREVNTGFIVIRCNERSLNFFESIQETEFDRLPYFEQSAINEKLKRNPGLLRWDVLPNIFWCKSVGGIPPRGIVLHHATCTKAYVKNGRKISSLEQKIHQLEVVRRMVHQCEQRQWLRIWYWACEVIARRSERLFGQAWCDPFILES